MGTSCRLLVMLDYRESQRAEKILDKAEFQLRYIESLASHWIEASELSRFNQATPGAFEFSKVNWEILQASKEAFEQTEGAFDVTCRPLIELWKRASEQGVLPDADAIAQARAQSSWNLIELDASERTAVRHAESAAVDVDGIAKGYAIDAALQAMVAQDVEGALVDVGGDVRVYGHSARTSGGWRFQIKNPRSDGMLGEFVMAGEGAVCTSGDYARYREIEGKRYSHIVDPVSGYPTEQVPTVTVVAPNALQADVWATALSVLGRRGVELLPAGVEAHLLMREAGGDDITVVHTPGFPELEVVHP